MKFAIEGGMLGLDLEGESCDFGGRLAMGHRGEHEDELQLVPHSVGLLPKSVTTGGVPRRLSLTVRTEAQEVPVSARILEVGLRFGMPFSVPSQIIASRLALEVKPGSIVLITGPSGSGKSLVLGEIARQFPTSRQVHNVQFPLDVAVLDAVVPTRPVAEAMQLLTACGLGEPMLWIRRYAQLSAGEQFRARLARAIGLHRRDHRSAPLLCDELGAVLHRRLAKALAFNLRNLASRERLMLVVATSQNDLEPDLNADHTVRLGEGEPIVESCPSETISKRPNSKQRREISFARRLRIERGTLRDYQNFSAMHYRQRAQVGFVDKVFICREGIGGPLVGIVVYGRSPLELRLRNQATGGRFVRQPKRLNHEMRILRRLVMHPDVRGCGLGHWLVRRTLPMVGTRFVECLAAMGLVNPVFEKAGMRRIGVCDLPASLEKMMVELRTLGADPLASNFSSQVCRRPSVRRLVADAVRQWHQVASNSNLNRATPLTPTLLAQTFRQIAGSQPAYYLWARDADSWMLIEPHLV